VTWKAKLKLAYPDPNDYSAFMVRDGRRGVASVVRRRRFSPLLALLLSFAASDSPDSPSPMLLALVLSSATLAAGSVDSNQEWVGRHEPRK